MVRTELRPRGPYSLRLSTRWAADATCSTIEGVFRSTIRVGERLEQVQAAQRADGTIQVAADSDAGVEHVRFRLGLDDDHSEFLRLFSGDPLLAETLRQVRGLRPVRTATVAHALLRAVAGQLIAASHARRIERTIVRACTPELGGLRAAPTCAELAAFAPARLAQLGLGARRGGALVRLCRSLDLETLKSQPTDAVVQRLTRERGLGPWSLGVICLEGLGRYEHGLARDLGLIKLLSARLGRRVEPEETDALLARYGPWAGLASVYLLAGAYRGLVPLADAQLAA
jgi:3-methyladenine DNA glycosylase/8-oxoguanine DNA glycosylase